MKNNLRQCLFGAVIALSVMVQGWSYVYSSHQSVWTPGPIPMQIKLGASGTLSDGTNHSSSVQVAMQTWNGYLGTVQFAPQIVGVGGQVDYVNDIYFDSTIEGQSFGSGVLAVTLTYTAPSVFEITETDIIFNTAYAWDSYRGNLQAPEDIRRVALHELGHALGLSHPDQSGQSVSALMNSTVSNLDALTADDITGAQSIYRAPGQTAGPGNDNFANATTISLSSGSTQVTGSTLYATKESGEPNHAGDAGGHSAWWKWTAPANGSITITTQGSKFDTLLGVYTGGAVSSLSTVASNDEATPGSASYSSVTFTAVSGTTYNIAVDGWDGSSGPIALNLNFTPAGGSGLMRVTMVGLIDYIDSSGAYLPSKGVRRGDPFTISATYDPTITSSPPGSSGIYPIDFSTSATISFGGLVYTMPGFRAEVVNNLVYNGGPGGFTTVDGHILQGTVPASSDLNALDFTSILYSSNTNLVGNAASYGLQFAQPSDYNFLCFFRLQGYDKINSYPAYLFNVSGSITSITAVPVSTTQIAPSITAHPVNQTPIEGQPAQFSASATGVPSPVLQWQRLPAGTNAWINLSQGGSYSGVNSNTLTVSGTTASMSGDKFRCLALSNSGGAASNAALLTVAGTVPVVINHPVDRTVTVGQVAQFAVTVAGNPLPTYQWQRQGSGTSAWANISNDGSFSGATTATLAINTALAFQGDQFRCIATNNQGTVTSNPGRLLLLTGVPGVIVAESGRSHTVFLGANGSLWGMGPNSSGELGLGEGVSGAPQSLITTAATGISAGNANSFYIKPDGTLWGTGFAGFGQFGNGTSSGSYLSPVQVASDVVQVAASADFTMHLKRDLTLWAAGRNNRGQFGTGGTGQTSSWGLVSTNVIWVATGPEHTLFIKSDGSLWAMGDNSGGQLGDGTLSERHIPVLIATNVIKAFGGSSVSYFIKADNTLWGMGSNGSGRLGDNSTIDRRSPVFIANNVVFVSAPPNGEHTLFIKTDGSLWGMGGNGVGQLGTGPGIIINQVPVFIANNVVAASTGGNFSTFAKSDGTYWGMGRSTSQFELSIPGYVDYFFPRLISIGSLVGPAVPSNVVAMDAGFLNGVNVIWSPTVGAASYEMWRGPTNNSAAATRIAEGLSTPIFHDSSAAPNVTYYYWIKAVNPAGTSAFSGSASVTTMGGPPVITSQPLSSSFYLASNAIFQIVAAGDPTLTLTYQWQWLPSGGGVWADVGEGSGYTGSNTTTLVVSNATLAMTGDQFRCVVTNTLGTATSNPATLTVIIPPPIIQDQPLSQTVVVGSPINLSVTATSPVTLSYQWRKNGTNIPGATSSTYTISSAQASDSGNYLVAISSSGGSAISNTATVIVASTPVINTHPATQTVTAGQPASFSVSATSAAPLSYMWRKNGTPIGGATAATYTIAVTQPSDAADYSVVVTNVAGSATSNAATLTVNVAPPVITAHPASKVITQGATAQFSITATGNPAPTYQWQVLPVGGGSWGNTTDGATYGGSQTATLTVSGATGANNGDQYRCVATNAGGSVTSNVASLSVTVNPAPIAVAAGGTFTTYLRFDGALFGTGTNTEGQLGDGTLTNRTAPVALSTGVAAMAAGTDHQLLLKADGSLWVNGFNTFGALGTNDTTSRSTPVQIATGVATFAAGHRHSLFVKNDGTLWAMGWNSTGQLGDGSTTNRLTPVQVATHVIAVAGGVSHSLFLKSNGTVWAMGDNSLGQLGDGTTTNRLTPVQIATGVASISAGGYFNLLLKTDGTLWAAGFNGFGQLGDSTTTNRLTPVQVATGVRAMSGGFHHSMYLKTDGTLWSAGYNDFGQIGDGSVTHRSVPFQLATGVTGLSAGRYQSAFIKADGSLWVVGGNNFGQLGDNTTTNRLTPVQLATGTVSLPALVTTLAATELVGSDRVTLTWNAAVGSTYYEVWRSTTTQFTDAVRIATYLPGTFFEDVTAATGVLYRYWVRSANGAGVTGFGSSDAGYFGVLPVAPSITNHPQSQTVSAGASVTLSVVFNGTAPLTFVWRKDGVNQNAPTVATGNSVSLTVANIQATAIYDVIISNAAGSVTSNAATVTVALPPTVTGTGTVNHVLAPGQGVTLSVTATGTGTLTYAWTHNGRPIPGATGSSLTLTNATFQDSGYYLAYITNAAGTVRSVPMFVTVAPALTQVRVWGANDAGQVSVPANLGNVVGMSAAASFSVARRADGTVAVWGGYGDPEIVPPAGLTGVVSIAAGNDHVLALKADGTVVAWGFNFQGQTTVPANLSDIVAVSAGTYFSAALGANGKVTTWGFETTTYPVPANLSGVAAIAAGGNHVLALKADGTVTGWGYNHSGQVTTPAGLADVVAIAAGRGHSLALRADGTVAAWGDNTGGQSTVPGGLANVVAIAAAGNVSFALKADGTVVAWGNTVSTNGPDNLPANLSGAIALAAGYNNGLVLRDATADTPPAITVQPVNALIPAGQTATFSVTATGSSLSYQWRKNGVNLIDFGTYVGAASATLTIPNSPAGAAGSYDVVVSNGIGSVTSTTATLAFAANFSSWQQDKFSAGDLLDVTISGPNADPDADGLSNLLEYALGLEPTAASTAGLPSAGVAGSDWTYTYTRPADRMDVTYTVESSTNLTAWSTTGVTHEWVSTVGDTETWRAKYPLTSAPNCYFRLKVVQ